MDCNCFVTKYYLQTNHSVLLNVQMSVRYTPGQERIVCPDAQFVMSQMLSAIEAAR